MTSEEDQDYQELLVLEDKLCDALNEANPTFGNVCYALAGIIASMEVEAPGTLDMFNRALELQKQNQIEAAQEIH